LILFNKPFSIQELIKKIESILENANNLKRSFFNNRGNFHQLVGGSVVERGFDTKCRQYNLTRREQEIIGLIAKGHSYGNIGELLFISKKTVTRHVQNIFEKVKVSNKIELLNKISVS
jgi:two-component system, sensor histidine kinase ChiS